jgi:hypothetical protein
MTDSLSLDWTAAISQVLMTGRAYAPGAVGGEMLQRLHTIELPWVDLDEQLPSGVYQQYAFAGIEPETNPVTAELCRQIAGGLAPVVASVAGLGAFVCNEASFHRYRPGDAGLSRHRDRDFYHYLVIGITLSGDGELHLFEDHNNGGQVGETWHTEPGDLYLFRAPGLDGCDDGRPAHATGTTVAGRTSLTLRHNTHGYGGGW